MCSPAPRLLRCVCKPASSFTISALPHVWLHLISSRTAYVNQEAGWREDGGEEATGARMRTISSTFVHRGQLLVQDLGAPSGAPDGL